MAKALADFHKANDLNDRYKIFFCLKFYYRGLKAAGGIKDSKTAW